MSEVHERTSAFFDLYRAHGVSEDAIGDFIDDWHNSGKEEKRQLWEFLGMTEDEYAVWVMDARTLPVLRGARDTNQNLLVAIEAYLAELHHADHAADRAAIYALSHWVSRRLPGSA